MCESSSVAIISAICSSAVAIVVPIATKIIDTYSQNKKIRLELYSKKRLECIEDYIRNINGDIMNKRTSSLSSSPRDIILMYIPKSQHHYISDIDMNLSKGDFNAAAKLLSDFCSQIKVKR